MIQAHIDNIDEEWMDGWMDGCIEEGTHAHIDTEGRYAHMKGSGRLYQDKEG